MLRLIKGTKAPIGGVLVGFGGGGQREVKGSRELAWRELCLALYLSSENSAYRAVKRGVNDSYTKPTRKCER